jgi:hypothetical protein
VFIGTPKGRNPFFQLWRRARIDIVIDALD